MEQEISPMSSAPPRPAPLTERSNPAEGLTHPAEGLTYPAEGLTYPAAPRCPASTPPLPLAAPPSLLHALPLPPRCPTVAHQRSPAAPPSFLHTLPPLPHCPTAPPRSPAAPRCPAVAPPRSSAAHPQHTFCPTPGCSSEELPSSLTMKATKRNVRLASAPAPPAKERLPPKPTPAKKKRGYDGAAILKNILLMNLREIEDIPKSQWLALSLDQILQIPSEKLREVPPETLNKIASTSKTKAALIAQRGAVPLRKPGKAPVLHIVPSPVPHETIVVPADEDINIPDATTKQQETSVMTKSQHVFHGVAGKKPFPAVEKRTTFKATTQNWAFVLMSNVLCFREKWADQIGEECFSLFLVVGNVVFKKLCNQLVKEGAEDIQFDLVHFKRELCPFKINESARNPRPPTASVTSWKKFVRARLFDYIKSQHKSVIGERLIGYLLRLCSAIEERIVTASKGQAPPAFDAQSILK